MRGQTSSRSWSHHPVGSGWEVVTGAGVLTLVVAAPAGSLPSASAKPLPQLSFTTSSVHFSVPADLPADALPEITLTLKNSGRTATGALKVTLPESSPFQVVDENCPRSLGPRKTCTVTVRFTPRGQPTAAATLTAAESRTAATLALLGVTGTVRDDSLPSSGSTGPPCDWTDWSKDTEECIVGTDGNDYIYGPVVADQQYGLAGDDNLHGSGGDDHIFGGAGNDLIHGNLNHDHVNGEDGNDTLYGNEGPDSIDGGYGTDTLYGGDGDDFLYGHDSLTPDTISGGGGYDECRVSQNDVILECEYVYASPAQ